MYFLNGLIWLVLMAMLSSCSSSKSGNFSAQQTVSIESIPSGAEIFCHGKKLGTTPIELSFQTDIVHEIYFKKPGFKSGVGYLNPMLKNNEKQFIQFGMAKDMGYYYSLSPSKLSVELKWEALPDTRGIVPFELMGALSMKADQMLRSGDLTDAEHKIAVRQIIELFE
ncbi:MAG: hypothetical protein CML08_01220 [Puniceicoccaceae bacterium]|nr:hypothetical protein [Puniceicoccaceae bacterium]|tara:strand:- start:413 stop:916 length:504 start_codon:yes stop_codon:yes gene_type:complete